MAQDLLLLEAGSQIYRVLNVQGSRVQLSAAINNGSGLLRTTALASPQLIDSNLRFVLPKERQLSTVWKADGSVASVHSVPVPAVPSQTLYQYVNGGDSARVHYLPNNSAAVFHVVDNAAAALQFEGKPGELASDDWVLLQSESGAWFSHRVASIDEVTKGYLISTSTNSSSQRWLNAVGHFSQVLAFAGHDKNTRPVWSTSSATNSVLEVELEHDIGALRPGRTLWVVGPQQRQLVEVATVDYFDSAINIATITVKPSLQSLYMPRFATEIFGNVVLAGHGESRAEHILGNGNRIEKNQQFTYAKTGVSFVQSAQFSSGVSAGIQVAVDGRNWTQVDNLRNASATDAHYTVHLTEEFYLQINFGDGEHGQRLPTGVNNLRIVARFGNGAKGNLAALSLDKLKKPHALLDQVIQPAAATGGGDLEPIESLRESAPASVLTLQRAVSVSDYAALAQRLSSVWQARAFPLPDLPGASDRIQVVLVPVGGGDLGELATSVGAYLHGRGRPGVEVLINRYRAIAIALILHLRIDAQGFDPDLVVDAVGTALEDAFSLYRSRLGEPLFRAQVYAVVEAIAGVESVDVDINPGPFVDEDGSVIAPETLNVYRGSDGSVRRLSPAPDQLIYINSNVQAAQISWEAANV